MVVATNLGCPRMGANRELKRALEAYWRGAASEEELADVGRELRERHWREQAQAGIDHIPSSDFSFYDHVLDTAFMLDAVPRRFRDTHASADLTTYFAMARGSPQDQLAAMEMTKWFDTNYHYIVPELEAGQTFRLASTAPVDRFLEAQSCGIHTRPVVLGPVSFLRLSNGVDRLPLLPAILPVYAELFARLADAGANWVQVDEPVLTMDLTPEERSAFTRTYGRFDGGPRPRILIATYFGALGDNLALALRLPVHGLHLDLVADPAQLDPALDAAPASLALSLGVVNGRNVWRTDLDAATALVRRATERLGNDRVLVGPSCSLLHVPIDVRLEADIDEELRGWLAFARQKLDEIRLITLTANGEDAGEVTDAFDASRRAREQRMMSPRTQRENVRSRARQIGENMLRRRRPFAERKETQRRRLGLPPLSTTTIGSFPQTPAIRRARAAFRRGELTQNRYDAFLAKQIDTMIELQEDLGLDVLVHGEPERSDMVEYFAEQMSGFQCTRNGWVQSYGSRCVRPPIIYGDVAREQPMTVRWSAYAQSRTQRPVKGMLTGPVTMLHWSFVRDDQPRSMTCRQIALAIRDEMNDLEDAGIAVIQIDEPALREGLPIRQQHRHEYLAWAVECFRLASSGAACETQIHTHMCYSEFGDILDAIHSLDADVISIEASRSGMSILTDLEAFTYPNDIGPGVYDIHSPRVPNREEIVRLLERALATVPAERLWVNPDCGLKTRRMEEVVPALRNMVAAARQVRNGVVAMDRNEALRATEFSQHAVDQSILRQISVQELRKAFANGEVIEDYPQDKYGPSCLILGFTKVGRPLHVQCSYPSRPMVKIITVYEPDPRLWIEYRTRKE